jgi:hypothetical protein
MSGPIVRKYGFPNFEKIFGERELKHGAEASADPSAPPASSLPTDPPKSAQEKAPAQPDPVAGKP